ncbi:MAG: TRAP transporter substrate-binding protein [Cyclobacteriaceae bacterium]|nr:TRAP transporter substrate-binding protein [Cyclobacteriaceae bacterium]
MRYAFVFLLLLAFNAGCRENEKIYRFRAGHVANTDHTWHKGLVYFSEIVGERSGGKIIVEIYPSEQLGKEIELIRSIKTGIADMTITAGTLQNWTDIVAFSDMPFIFRDTVHMKKLAEGTIGKFMEQRILEETGLRIIAYFQRGPRHLTSNRPITRPDELNGFILRVPNVPSYTVAWSALGANPTPMALSEVFTSLQQGTIQGQENPLAMISSTNLYEVQDYVNLTGHLLAWGYVVVGDKKFSEMPEYLQKIFLDAAAEMQAYEHSLFLQNENLLREELERRGMTFVEVDREAFREIGAPAVYQSLSPEMQSLYDEIVNIK